MRMARKDQKIATCDDTCPIPPLAFRGREGAFPGLPGEGLPVAPTAPSRTAVRSGIAALALLAAPLAVAAAVPAQATGGTTYYVDPVKGSDSNAGTRTTKPWRTLGRATSAVLRPGDTVRLAAGRTHTGSLTIAESGTAAAPIVVDTWGSGTAPVVTGGGCITITGDRVTVRRVEVRGCAYGGVALSGAHGRVEGITARGNVAGVYVAPEATWSTITGSTIVDNRVMVVRPGADDDYGAHGILVEGDHTTIDTTTIRGHHAASPDYGVDGSAIEVFGAVGTRIHHVRASDNKAFLELGGYAGNLASDTMLAWSEVTGSLTGQHFLVTRGAGQVFGPVTGTLVVNNTVRLTGADAVGVGCYGGCGTDVLTVRNNIVDVNGGWSNADGPFVSQHNVYNGWWGVAPAATDLRTAPGYVDAAAGDLRLAVGSPAVDTGVATAAAGPYDMAGVTVSDGNGDGLCAPDRGAWERAGAAYGC